MKIGWGTGIALFYILFVLSLLYQLKVSMRHNHNLVVENYYEHDLDYQNHYDRLANSQGLATPVQMDLRAEAQELLVQFPEDMGQVQGSILFFRPNDKKQDFNVPIHTNRSNSQSISVEGLSKGLWKVKINWQYGSATFYDEKTVVL